MQDFLNGFLVYAGARFLMIVEASVTHCPSYSRA
jgi:hypothetical protein